MQHVDHVLPCCTAAWRSPSPCVSRRHRGACVRRVAALRSGWLPVTTLGLSLTGRRSGLDGALGSGRCERSPMEIFQFDRGERIVESYGSRGLRATRVAAGTRQVGLTCLARGPGGVIWKHPATGGPPFLGIAGQGLAAGAGGG